MLSFCSANGINVAIPEDEGWQIRHLPTSERPEPSIVAMLVSPDGMRLGLNRYRLNAIKKKLEA